MRHRHLPNETKGGRRAIGEQEAGGGKRKQGRARREKIMKLLTPSAMPRETGGEGSNVSDRMGGDAPKTSARATGRAEARERRRRSFRTHHSRKKKGQRKCQRGKRKPQPGGGQNHRRLQFNLAGPVTWAA